jgi:helicase required for RNAi-mediated heterochromatin assembly 1
LQARCDVQDLEGDPFFLNMSMFERLVHNNVEFRTLTLQRRMAPEIRRLLAPIYETLEDHPSVNSFDKVPGMGDIRSFFFCHSWPESSDSLASKYNADEAHMVVGFFIHLVFSGISVKDITVLTFYNGQRKKILKLLKDSSYLQGQYVKVATVDSYQGEENEVVLLSLVRSSEERKIGFLAVENRVCVAMSRAKRGFYVFGNGQALATADPLWWEIIKIMGQGDEESRRIGYHLPLTCNKHGNKTFVRGKCRSTGP